MSGKEEQKNIDRKMGEIRKLVGQGREKSVIRSAMLKEFFQDPTSWLWRGVESIT